MSEQDTIQTYDDNYIPDESEVTTPQGGGAWRISSGKIQRGREEDKTLETRDKIVGRLSRFAVQDGIGAQTSKPYSYLEAEIETAQGPVRVHTNLLDKAGRIAPSASCISFAEGLLQMAPNELMIVTARQSFKVNEFGTYSTYANLFHLKPGETRGRETSRRKWPDDTKFAEMWPVLLAELQKHPCWKVREREEGEEGSLTHFSEFVKECAAKGWPTPNQAPNAWLEKMAAAGKHPVRPNLSSYTDDEWGQIRMILKDRTELPDFLVAAKALLDGPSKPETAAFEGF